MATFKDSFAFKFALSKRQAEVAELIAIGMRNIDIAERLGITEKGVKFHATNLYRAVKVKGRKEFKALIAELWPCQSSA